MILINIPTHTVYINYVNIMAVHINKLKSCAQITKDDD